MPEHLHIFSYTEKHHCFLRQLDFVQKLWSDQYHPPSLTAGGGKGLRVLREEGASL